MALALLAVFVGGCDSGYDLDVCQRGLKSETEGHKKEVAQLKQQAVDRAAKVARRYTDATSKVTETAVFRRDHRDMPRGTILCRIGGIDDSDHEFLLFPAEVETLRKEQLIYHSNDWLMEEFKEQKVDKKTEFALPPEPPAPEPKPTPMPGSEAKI